MSVVTKHRSTPRCSPSFGSPAHVMVGHRPLYPAAHLRSVRMSPSRARPARAPEPIACDASFVVAGRGQGPPPRERIPNTQYRSVRPSAGSGRLAWCARGNAGAILSRVSSRTVHRTYSSECDAASCLCNSPHTYSSIRLRSGAGLAPLLFENRAEVSFDAHGEIAVVDLIGVARQ